MRHFISVLEATKRQDINLFKRVAQAHPFVIHTFRELTNIKINREEKIDLPFRVCSFELLAGSTLLKAAQVDEESSTGRSDIEVYCIIAEEISPGEIIFWGDIKIGNVRQIRVASKEEDVHAWSICHTLTLDFLAMIQNGQHGSSSTKEIVKYRENGQKKTIKINKVIHIRQRDIAEKSSSSGAIINWSHAFWVMGHWRTIDGLGKDRDGIYCVPGKTWIEAFVKQAALGDPITKIRVVKQADSV